MQSLDAERYAEIKLKFNSGATPTLTEQITKMEHKGATPIWNGAEPWVVELNRGLKGGQIIGVESNVVGLGDGRGRLSILVSLADDLEFDHDLFEVRIFQGGVYWRMASNDFDMSISEIKGDRENQFGGLNFLDSTKTTICEVISGPMQIVQEAEIYDIFKRLYDSDNSEFGLQINTQIRRLECDLPTGFPSSGMLVTGYPEGFYNLTVIHRGFGALKISEHAWNAQTSYTKTLNTTSVPNQQKYMFRTLIRVETNGQGVISHLGGFLNIVAPRIAKGLSLDDLQNGKVTVNYEDNDCTITKKVSDNEIRCYIHKPTQPISRTYYAGNQGVSVLTKGCTKSYFYNDLETDTVTDAGYSRDRISSFFQAYRYSDSTCVRYQSILNYDIT